MGSVVHRIAAVGLVSVVLAGCAAPKHTNTLVFGTNTRLALDVSQDPTASVGITLGYKRQEAVWMPLLPNQQDLVPAECSTRETQTSGNTTNIKDCPMFVGTDKDRNVDTYSVLASFGSKAAAGAGTTTEARTEIAQYFATGLAARSLAVSGGASLVNTGSKPTQEQLQEVGVAIAELERVMQLVTSADGKSVDPAKLKSAFAKEPGLKVPTTIQTFLQQASSPGDLRERLSLYQPSRVVHPMLVTLTQ